MEFLNKIQQYFNSLEQKRFFQYMMGFLAGIILIIALLLFNYYRSISRLKAQIIRINEEREETRAILDKATQVKKEQKQIDAILAEDENFKIVGYFEDLISKLGLNNKKSSIEVTSPAREGNYQESILQAKFIGITMKDLTELLQEIELNKRVFTKELDITASSKQPGTIDVSLTIATLEPKPKEIKESSERKNE